MLYDHTAFAAALRAPAFHSVAGTAQSKAELFDNHNGMVRSIAWRVYAQTCSAIDLEDLVQIGLLALVECAESYEDRGFAFATYASTRVRGAMLDQLRKSAPLSRSAMANRRAISLVRDQLEQEYMRAPTADEMAVAMDVDIVDYYQKLNSTLPTKAESIAEIYSDQDSRFADPEATADNRLQSAQMQTLLKDSLAALSERDAKILDLYFGEEWNLEKIGQTLGVGAARVCQIKKTILQKLRRQLEPAL